MTLQRNQPEHANATLLCRPLYTIYLESAAFQEVYPNLIASVTIDGDPDDAKKVNASFIHSNPQLFPVSDYLIGPIQQILSFDFNQVLAKMQASAGAEDDSDSETDDYVVRVHVTKKKRRKSRTASRGGRANTEEQNQLKAFLRPFPLSVTLTFKTSDGKIFPVRLSGL